MKRFSILTFIALLSLSLNSCMQNNNDDDDNILPDASFAKEISKAEAISNETATLVDFTFEQGSDISFKDGFPFGNCATIEFDIESNPKKTTIDFGETNCLCEDNRYRRGKIVVEYTGNYNEAGSNREVSTQNYHINDNEIILNRTVTTIGYNASEHLEFTITENGTINWADGGNYNWNSNRKREWIEGEGTAAILDDVYLITGTASGENSDGDNFTKEITSPLKYKLNCANIVSGVVSITMNNAINAIINFGDGVCDNTAIVTILGMSFEITLW